ncbi:Hpt domain-containing protein [Shewanella frigidimarina]|jgi:HPt (histidine-containing phosphotransfer) domain-containing protein|uniref:Hpt domain-containing protein n=1 Tax=Shewanella frigidimarina TaxID=56812 RepID=UPI000F4E74A0|nr:Hpt domain-containing protein [Shewanella frigidimarina]RPA64321.1 Hpt domain-containing protein [Shewanella frigidimarina]
MNISERRITLFCIQHQLDYQQALTHFSGNKSLYFNAVQLFINDLTLYIQQTMASPFIPIDFALMLHTLKSSAATLGFTELVLCAQSHEAKLAHSSLAEFNHFHEVLLDALTTNKNLAIMLIPLLENDLQASNSQKDMPILAVNNEFIMIYDTLMEEVNHYNMNAINTFAQIAKTLNLIAPQHIELLTQSINQLRFQQAENILTEIYPRILDIRK